MSDVSDQRLLDLLLDSWDRNNTILLNLLRALPDGGLETRAIESATDRTATSEHEEQGDAGNRVRDD